MDLSSYSDEDLIYKIQELDYEKTEINIYYEELFERYHNQIYNLCRYHGLKHNDSLDIIQEVFLRLFTSIKSFRKNSLFKPWFFKIVLNSVRDKFNELKKHKLIEINYINDFISEEEKFFDLLQNKEYIKGIINSLPSTLKEVVILKVYGELDMKEIAAALGISLRQAYNRFNDGCKMLKDKLGENYGKE